MAEPQQEYTITTSKIYEILNSLQGEQYRAVYKILSTLKRNPVTEAPQQSYPVTKEELYRVKNDCIRSDIECIVPKIKGAISLLKEVKK
jgi:hypothetical protein